MKFKRIICLCLAIMTAASLFSFTAFAADASVSSAFLFYEKANGYSVYDGVSDTRTASISNNSSYTELVPEENTVSEPVTVMHTDISKAGIPLEGKRYIVYKYYYMGTRTDIRPTLTLHAKKFSVTAEKTAAAMDTLACGRWEYIVFDVGDYMGGYFFKDGTIPEMSFRPYGDIPAKELTDDDSIRFEQIMFWTKETADKNGLEYKYPVFFVPGRSEAEGESPETLYAAVGETVTLPENPYTLDGYTFNGWVSSDGNVVYEPGDEVTVIEKTITGGYNTGRTYFVANWSLGEDGDLPDVKAVKFYNYNDGSKGIVDAQYGQYVDEYRQKCTFDGVIASKYAIMAEGSDCYNTYQALEITTANKKKNSTFNLDGWHWTSLPLDIKHYKHCAVLYYWKTDNTASTFYRPILSFLKGSSGALTDRATVKATNSSDSSVHYLKKNQWAVMEFSFDFENTPSLAKLTDFETSTVVNQLHFQPFGTSNIKNFYGDELYIADFVFFSEKPSGVTYSNGFITGNGDGTFRPNDPLTKAESAAMLARAMGYAEENADSYTETGYEDIAADAWYLEYVSFLEKNGVLNPSEDGSFGGDGNADRSDFARMLVNAASGGISADAHKPGGIKHSTGSELTRAEAVVYTNSFLKGVNYSGKDIEFLKASDYSDVAIDGWYSADVILSSNNIMLYESKSGVTGLCALPARETDSASGIGDISAEQYAEAEEYLAQLDITTQSRINQIRGTASEYSLKDGGTVYYISSTEGSESSTGTSESNPFLAKTLESASYGIAPKAGDVVLFKRGDTFTGTLQTVRGVTYSAYGDEASPKPLFVRTPLDAGESKNWTLAHEDKITGCKIWKYSDETLMDIGGINLIDANGNITVAYKEIPSFDNTKMSYVLRDDTSVVYDYKVQLDHDLMYFHEACYNGGKLTSPVTAATQTGPVYLRCDKGNPGAVYSDITLNEKGHSIKAVSDVTIDNICIKYFGSHGISAGTVNNLTVTNCEIGWGGGSIQHYTSDGRVTRFGNGVEIYGGLTNYRIDNCYVYEIYDAGITHQISSSSPGNYHMDGVYYTNNILLNSTYNIEYFMSKNAANANGVTEVKERMMTDVYFTGNIARCAGYGWGVQRPDSAPSNIKGWSHNNFCNNYVIENNVFDRCVNLRVGDDYVIQVGASYDNSAPYLKNNVFVQVPGRILMTYGRSTYGTTANSESSILNTFGGDGNKLYFCKDDASLYTHHVFWED